MRSSDRADGTPIPFSALSGLAAGSEENVLYTVEDSFYKQSRILTIDTTEFPAIITGEMRVMDTDGVFAGVLESTNFTGIINSDNTVNIDLEGIAVAAGGGFWLAHEGRGTVGDPDRPVESPNVVFKVTADAAIEKVILLPDELNQIQLRFGMEGIAESGKYLVVTMQRAWGEDANPRLAVYDTESESWKFLFYPLDEASSPNGGWVGLSDISAVGDGKFLVLERDNQGGPDAAIKKIYSVDLGDFSGEDGSTVEKTLVMDLMDTLKSFNGIVFEKIEGMALTMSGDVWIVNDNDGVDDNSCEQRLINLGAIMENDPVAPPPADEPAEAPMGEDDEPTDEEPAEAPMDEDPADEEPSSGSAGHFTRWVSFLVASVVLFF